MTSVCLCMPLSNYLVRYKQSCSAQNIIPPRIIIPRTNPLRTTRTVAYKALRLRTRADAAYTPTRDGTYQHLVGRSDRLGSRRQPRKEMSGVPSATQCSELSTHPHSAVSPWPNAGREEVGVMGIIGERISACGV